MTETDEFLAQGHNASFFYKLIERVSLEVEKQYSDYAQNAKPCFGNHPYWQMSTDVPIFKLKELIEELNDTLYEPDNDTATECLESMRSCKKKIEEMVVQAVLAFICVGTEESNLMRAAEKETEKEYHAEPEGAPEDVTHDEEVASEIAGIDWKPDRDEQSFKEVLDRYLTGSDW